MNPEFWIDFDIECETDADINARERAIQDCVLARRKAPIMYDERGVKIGHHDTKAWRAAREEFARLTEKYLAAEAAAWVCYARQYDLSEYREAKQSFSRV